MSGEYRTELSRLQVRLQEFMADADEELKGLVKWQTRLDERHAECERQHWLHAQRYAKTHLRDHSRLQRRLEEMQRSLRLCRETVRLACQKLLRHGNLLLDSEDQVKLQLRRLDELLHLVVDGRGVEVTRRWSEDTLGRGAAVRSRLLGQATSKHTHTAAER